MVDRARTEQALDTFLIELATFHDELAGRKRAEGVSEREWGLRYLRELVSGARWDISSLRSDLESRAAQALTFLEGDHEGTTSYRRTLRVLMASFDFVVAVCEEELAALASAESGACTTCGKASPRHYCEACARAINLEEYENPLHGA